MNAMLLGALMLVTVGFDDPSEPDAVPAAPPVSASVLKHAPASMPSEHAQAIARGVEVLLAMQEGTEIDGAPSEWPYEGVYRVRRKIPLGYRVGGTGICGEALLRSPGYASDARRQAAIARAIAFVCSTVDHSAMNPVYRGGYDVRGWGYCYGLRFLLAAKALHAIPEALQAQAESTIDAWTAALQKIEIPDVGGWTYSRRGIDEPCPTSPFMTAPCVETLRLAAAQGETVDGAVVDRALAALERTRSSGGNVAYSAKKQSTLDMESMPGAIGRMTALEAAMFRAGRGSTARVAFAVDAFNEHWDALEARRRKNGTHKAPYGVAPYYFFYAHFAAADAASLLPADERKQRVARINERLFSVREADGRWNDRVFDRSANYGTAMAMLGLLRGTGDVLTPAKPSTPPQ
jgi:hypothetical protein